MRHIAIPGYWLPIGSPTREFLTMTQPVDLDPENWDEFRETSHRALDAMIDYLRDVRARPVWQEPSPEARERFARELPLQERQLSEVLADFERHIKPFATEIGRAHV